MNKLLLIVFLIFGISSSAQENIDQKIKEVQYKKQIHYLNFFKKKYYDKANKELDKLKKLYNKKKDLHDIEKNKKKKEKLKKEVDKLKQKFEIAACIVRYYEFMKESYEAGYRGERKEKSNFFKKAYLARLEYEDLSGKYFSDILAEYNKYRYKEITK